MTLVVFDGKLSGSAAWKRVFFRLQEIDAKPRKMTFPGYFIGFNTQEVRK
jgi:hypothetical protein